MCRKSSPRREGSEMWGYPYWPACMGCYEVFLLCLGGFSLTELTDLTEPLCAQFRAHRRPPAYRYHRTFQLKVAVRFCEIGWLNVSVECCVFCSSVFFCENKYTPSMWERTLEIRWGVFFSHRAHRVHWAFWRTFRAHRTLSSYRDHRGLSTNISCNALCFRLT